VMCFPTQPIGLDLDPRYHNDDDDGGGGGFHYYEIIWS
jgi:hypothetical protein